MVVWCSFVLIPALISLWLSLCWCWISIHTQTNWYPLEMVECILICRDYMLVRDCMLVSQPKPCKSSRTYQFVLPLLDSHANSCWQMSKHAAHQLVIPLVEVFYQENPERWGLSSSRTPHITYLECDRDMNETKGLGEWDKEQVHYSHLHQQAT